MSTVADLETVLTNRFRTLIAAGGDGGAPVATTYANLEGGDSFSEPATDPWVRWRVSVTRDHVELATVRQTGLGVASVFVLANQGRKPAEDIWKRVAAAFDNQVFSGARCRASSMVKVGPVAGRRRYQFDVQVPADLDE